MIILALALWLMPKPKNTIEHDLLFGIVGVAAASEITAEIIAFAYFVARIPL